MIPVQSVVAGHKPRTVSMVRGSDSIYSDDVSAPSRVRDVAHSSVGLGLGQPMPSSAEVLAVLQQVGLGIGDPSRCNDETDGIDRYRTQGSVFRRANMVRTGGEKVRELAGVLHGAAG